MYSEECSLKKETKVNFNILVTGTSSGLGEAMAQTSGFKVFKHQRKKTSDNEETLGGDISSRSFPAELTKFMLDKQIDILVNNAGLYSNTEALKLESTEIREIVETNLLGGIEVIMAAVKAFRVVGRGTIVNINSISVLNPSSSESIYCTTKLGLLNFSRSLKISLQKEKIPIRIIDFIIGGVQTRLTKSRDNYAELIDVYELANFILSTSVANHGFRVDEIVIRREYCRPTSIV